MLVLSLCVLVCFGCVLWTFVVRFVGRVLWGGSGIVAVVCILCTERHASKHRFRHCHRIIIIHQNCPFPHHHHHPPSRCTRRRWTSSSVQVTAVVLWLAIARSAPGPRGSNGSQRCVYIIMMMMMKDISFFQIWTWWLWWRFEIYHSKMMNMMKWSILNHDHDDYDEHDQVFIMWT